MTTLMTFDSINEWATTNLTDYMTEPDDDLMILVQQIGKILATATMHINTADTNDSITKIKATALAKLLPLVAEFKKMNAVLYATCKTIIDADEIHESIHKEAVRQYETLKRDFQGKSETGIKNMIERRNSRIRTYDIESDEILKLRESITKQTARCDTIKIMLAAAIEKHNDSNFVYEVAVENHAEYLECADSMCTDITSLKLCVVEDEAYLARCVAKKLVNTMTTARAHITRAIVISEIKLQQRLAAVNASKRNINYNIVRDNLAMELIRSETIMAAAKNTLKRDKLALANEEKLIADAKTAAEAVKAKQLEQMIADMRTASDVIKAAAIKAAAEAAKAEAETKAEAVKAEAAKAEAVKAYAETKAEAVKAERLEHRAKLMKELRKIEEQLNCET